MTEDRQQQFLAYSMIFSAKEDLAMILPVPVRAGAREQAVTFINLEEYPQFFDDVGKGFPAPPLPGGLTRGTEPQAGRASVIDVVQVGSFEASFVPTIADFGRLDERFRLPPGSWEKLPAYRGYGFAIFKLKRGAKKVHPMAFSFARPSFSSLSFPRANLRSLFFPTVHIHDGLVHARADFDHLLYCQREEGDAAKLTDWIESRQLARSFMQIEKTKGMVAADRHCYQTRLHGQLENSDLWL